MAADKDGNDLGAVKVVLSSKILLAHYDASKSLNAAMIAKTVADPMSKLTGIFTVGQNVGLITSDGAPEDGRDGDDATEFHQPGYKLQAADPKLTLGFTVAEDNDLTREIMKGKPDSSGVYHVKDIVQDAKWFAYQETVYKTGVHRRRLGVVQVTNAEPDQDNRGEVSGVKLTAEWAVDVTVDSGNSKYLESYYTPTA